MRRRVLFILLFFVLFFGSKESYAVSANSLAINIESNSSLEAFSRSGYTIDGVFYEVKGDLVEYAESYVNVNRTVMFYDEVEPDDNIYWEEYINDELYAGILNLIEYEFYEGITTAMYSGKLYKVQTVR